MNFLVSTVSFALGQYVQGSYNLALLKPTSMSLTPNEDFGSEHAVDGVLQENIFTNKICTYVGDAGSSWWQVDLQQTVWISHVILFRAEYLSARPTDFKLLVLPDPRCSSSPQTCAEYTGTPTGVSSTHYCTQPLRGRIVRITQMDPFFLCEVQVFEFEETSSSMYFTKFAGRRREIEYPLEQEVKSAGDCGRSCVQEGWSYFNYKQQGCLCQLPSVSNHSDVITSEADWDHYEEDPCTFY